MHTKTPLQIDFSPYRHLPIFEKENAIFEALKKHQVVIVAGSTGSGKSTQLGKMAIKHGFGLRAKIAHTQPRRLAAQTLAQRVAEELKLKVGQGVGLSLRFVDQTSKADYITFLTDGLLLSQLNYDAFLNQYDLIILDEAHERSLNIDFLLAYFKTLIAKRRDLKIIITSATIDVEKIAHYFNCAPIIEASGRLYPVEIQYLTDEEAKKDKLELLIEKLEKLILKKGDILVFMATEKEIADALKLLRKNKAFSNVECLPLYARLSPQKQKRIFESSPHKRIILATNVAETSLTVPRIRFVVDLGTARIKRYAYHQRIERLPVEKIAQAAANQRLGRAGRLSSGVCLRLYTQEDFQRRSPFTEPEILRSNLANVLLKMKALHFQSPAHFPLLDSPPEKAWAAAEKTLKELSAVDEQGNLNALGRRLASLPVDVVLARILFAALDSGVLKEALVLVCALSVPHFWENHPRSAALHFEKKCALTVEKPFSQFMECLKFWKKLENNEKSLDSFAEEYNLNPKKIREWRDIHSQLKRLFQKKQIQDWNQFNDPVFYQKIHCALLTGFLGFIGCKTEKNKMYQGVKNLRFYLHPSIAIKENPPWIMAADLIETNQLFAHFIAQIQPIWVENLAQNFLQKNYSNPHWSKKKNAAMIDEKTSLWGLTLCAKRKIFLSSINIQEARFIFIQQALVKMDILPDVLNQFSFLKHNLKMMNKVKELEVKQRREDILIDDSLIFNFYHHVLSENIFDFQSLSKWLNPENEQSLYLSQTDLMNHDACGITSDNFPKKLHIQGKKLNLTYRFSPQDVQDGVTLKLPLMDLNSISAGYLEWLVPGLLKNKILFLLKTLPQKYRAKLEKLEILTEEFLNQKNLNFKEGILWNLILFLKEKYSFESRGWPLNKDVFREENLPDYLLMNIELLDESGKTICFSRNLNDLKKQYSLQAQKEFVQNVNLKNDQQDITEWNFGELEDILELEVQGKKIIGYPALCFENNRLVLNVFDEEEMAQKKHHQGLLELFKRHLKSHVKNLEKSCPNNLMLLFSILGNADMLKKQWLNKVFEECCLKKPLPKNQIKFLNRIEEAKPKILLVGNEMALVLTDILMHWHKQKLNSLKAFPLAQKDIEKQRNVLIHAHFIENYAWENLKHFPRYLKAMNYRIEKVRENPNRDLENQRKIDYFLTLYMREQKEFLYQNKKVNDFYWLIEELRVSLFANALKTSVPVSVKRLEKIWASLK